MDTLEGMLYCTCIEIFITHRHVELFALFFQSNSTPPNWLLYKSTLRVTYTFSYPPILYCIYTVWFQEHTFQKVCLQLFFCFAPKNCYPPSCKKVHFSSDYRSTFFKSQPIIFRVYTRPNLDLKPHRLAYCCQNKTSANINNPNDNFKWSFA